MSETHSLRPTQENIVEWHHSDMPADINAEIRAIAQELLASCSDKGVAS